MRTEFDMPRTVLFILSCKSTNALCYIYNIYFILILFDLIQKGVTLIVKFEFDVFLSGVPVHELTTNVKSTPRSVLYCLLCDNNMTMVTSFNGLIKTVVKF